MQRPGFGQIQTDALRARSGLAFGHSAIVSPLCTCNDSDVAICAVIESGQCSLVGWAVMSSHSLLYGFEFKQNSALHQSQFVDG